MGIGTWGFAKGASKNLLDNIASRQEFEMQLEKEKKLAELRAEQQKDLYVFQKDIDRKDRDDKLTETDYTNGFVIFRNGDNEEIGRRKLNQAEMEAYELGTQKDKLDIEGKQVTIQSARQRMALDQQENARAAARHRSGMSEDSGSASESSRPPRNALEANQLKDRMAQELLYRNKDTIPDRFAGNAGNVAREVVEVWTRRQGEFKKKGVTLDSVWRETLRNYK